MWILLFILCINALLLNSEETKSYLITAPNVVHVGTEETVAIQLHGAQSPITIQVYFEDEIKRIRLSKTFNFNLSKDNSYQEVQSILIDPEFWARAEMSKRRQKPYVLLVAENKELFGGRKTTRILLSSRKGYIFIQTDKPIYTPKEKVKFRVFTLDNYMKPVDDNIQIQVLNEKDLVVKTDQLRSRKMLSEMFEIPDIAQPGMWKIVAWFLGFEMSKASTKFDVRKYELPTFEVKIIPSKPYYHVNDSSFSFDIHAKHSYGKAVVGIVFVRFGLLIKQNKTFVPGLEQQASMKDGKATVILYTSALEAKIDKSIDSLKGENLYIALTAVETASGEIREEEYTGIKFLSSPYTIDLSKTKHFFVPGAPFSIMASITFADGSPASDVPCILTINVDGSQILQQTRRSNQEGLLSLVHEIPVSANKLDVMVTAEGGEPGMTISAKSYQSPSKSFLGISVPHTVLEPGEAIDITLKDIHQSDNGNVDYFYYMIVTKGKVIQMGRVQSPMKTFKLSITKAMVPAFRLIAYYFIRNQNEIIADSVWIDIKDVCEGKIEVRPGKEKYKPADFMKLSIETAHGGTVALVVVDTAVFILNNRNKLTSKKVFDVMNSYDLGCSIGGGANTFGVFTDAGLAFVTNTMTSAMREDYVCQESFSGRSKRSADFHQTVINIAKKYEDAQTRKCCYDGMKLNPMRFSCDKRLTKVRGTNLCKEAFKDCCERIAIVRKKLKEQNTGLARTSTTEDLDIFDESSVKLRSEFPESWWWTAETVKGPGIHWISKIIPDSITTWEIQAVHFHDRGFCVAEPKTFQAFQDVFLSLRLPYSVKRYEQLQVKAIVYNYQSESIKVTVKMEAVKELCSPASSGKIAQQHLTVPANSAVPVYFSVVPMEVGEIPITVSAWSSEESIDSVMKKLTVVSEGILRTEDITKYLSNGRRENVNLIKPSNMIPDTDSHIFMSLKGDIMGESIENCLSSNTIDDFIRVPTGCGEQTMVKMAPAMYAIEYLDVSEQWVQLKEDRKDEAIQMIDKGYTRMLTFQNRDGSFAIYRGYEGGTWLTAFVVKVFIKCMGYIHVEISYIHKAVSFLIQNQRNDGSFHDPYPVMDREMQGGIRLSEGDLSLTAFVTIALHHALSTYKSSENKTVKTSIENAIGYMERKLDYQLSPYSAAITAYALSLVNPNTNGVLKAEQILSGKSVFVKETKLRYWPASTEAISIETTSYALLQALIKGNITYAKTIANWLIEKRKYGGGFCSTQDTVVALEALSKYSLQTVNDPINLKIDITDPGRGKGQIIHLKNDNALTEEKLQFEFGNKINVAVSGQGTGSMTILKVYHSSEQENNTCNHLTLDVQVNDFLPEPEDLNYNYDDYESVQNDDPLSTMTKLDWFDIRSRRRRDVSASEKKKEDLHYTICIKSEEKDSKTEMFLVDLTLLSGLEPVTEDLDQLINSADKYIDFYEYKKGKILLYFGKISDGPGGDCIKFRVKTINPMGLVQPANAIAYDFYNPSRKCSIFYNAPQKSSLVSTLCQGEVCQCAEGPCPKEKCTFKAKITEETRLWFACYSPIVDYAYRARIKGSTQKNTFTYYEAEITKVFTFTGDETIKKGNIRQFIKRSSCALNLKNNQEYLLMGKDGHTVDSNSKIQYFLDSKVWIEEIPSADVANVSTKRVPFHQLITFMDNYEINQCNA
ncbi:complement C4-A-like [Rhinatrema bivittatum]|uniref:complement C4-A-like n=1 Tax=Rhinatrema bivittatum TaxID=194408 RepID=UPI001129FF93|nr:complement C4-A-like [Rhinatrema bivittatum]